MPFFFSGDYSSLRTQQIEQDAQLELANLDSIQADIEREKARIHMRLSQVRSTQNLHFGQGK